MDTGGFQAYNHSAFALMPILRDSAGIIIVSEYIGFLDKLNQIIEAQIHQVTKYIQTEYYFDAGSSLDSQIPLN